MFRIKEKIERRLTTKRSENSFLRLFRSGAGFQTHIGRLAGNNREDSCDYSESEIREAVLGAEQVKARAMMESQRHQRVC